MTVSTMLAGERFTWSSTDQVTITPGKRKQQAREQAATNAEPGTQLVQQFLNAAATDRRLRDARHRLNNQHQQEG